MYNDFFSLRENPFSITPDPAYLYLSAIHQEALGHLLYGTGEEGGFVLLTGEVGTGKTTLVRALLEQDMHAVDVALVLNPRLTETEFLAAVCDELKIKYTKTAGNKVLVDLLNKHLLKTHSEGRRTVLIVDEAQNLSHDVLEQVRLLTNLETAREKLLRIMLVGQPELQDMLGEKALRQLSQRITARYHLRPLSFQETRSYIAHRLSVAGGRTTLFMPTAIRAVHRVSRGIPRVVNIVCDRALLGAYAEDAEKVSAKIVKRAAQEALGNTHGVGVHSRYRNAIAVGAACLMVGGVVLASYLGREPVEMTPKPEQTSVETPETMAAVTPIPPEEPVMVAEPEPASPPPVPVSQKLFGAQPTDRLMDRLVALWNTSPPPSGVAPCQWLKANVDLHCFQAKDSYDTWRQFDRPSILRFKLKDDSLRHVLVTEANASGVWVQTPNEKLKVERTWLDQHWTGDYLLLWQPPFGRTQLDPQASTQAREWLEARLELADFGSVSAFQAEHGLQADGLAGIRTLLTLVAATEETGPRLAQANGEAR